MRKILLGFLVFSSSLALWTVWIEPASLRVAEYRLTLPAWPANNSGLRIALIADLHIGSPFNGLNKLRRVVAETNGAHPDLILLAGDFVIQGVPGGRFVPPESTTAILRDFRAPLGVFAVLGNHDWWFSQTRVSRALTESGIGVLEQQATKVSGGRFRFWLLGLGDLWEGRHDVDAALNQIRDDDPVLVLTHNPDLFPDIPDRVALTMAGHTHGGQVWLPFLGRPIVPSRYGQRFAIGHIVEHGRHLFVSPGIGTSVLPVRFRVPPEISLVHISGGSPAAQGAQLPEKRGAPSGAPRASAFAWLDRLAKLRRDPAQPGAKRLVGEAGSGVASESLQLPRSAKSRSGRRWGWGPNATERCGAPRDAHERARGGVRGAQLPE